MLRVFVCKNVSKIYKLLLIFILCFQLCGCWDYRDINKRSILISIGVDRIGDLIQFSGEIAGGAGAEGKKNQEVKRVSVYPFVSYGENFEIARLDLINKVPQPEFLGAVKVVVFSKKYAEEGIEAYLNRINGEYDYRKTLLAVISKDPPKKLFCINTNKEQSIASLIENNINYQTGHGKALYTTVGEMLSDISMKDIGYLIPYIGWENDSITYLGLGVMKDSKLIDIIHVKDTDGILYLLAKNPKMTEEIPSIYKDENLYSLRTTVKKRKITTNYVNNKPVINIDLDIYARVRYQYYIKPIDDKEIERVEDELSSRIKKYVEDAIYVSQKKYKCDIFEFAKYFRGEHPEIYRKIDWKEEYTNAIINVNVKTTITNLNLYDHNTRVKY
ncbi:spore germination protein A3 precursor [Clostridium tepidiprofundi DSM 19306]|uniref:Spore germination protein A3 n=1 Tax=Clostridium tepidiprofundi DSM 19306 TaxID=1121338 RepID=A0A151AVK0_9CLOT|nr:Ger(x)C family spore germination protein [Clostridium tepidiprofundi]KYH31668.1 spore germination protein A3 precursor [Clostridium tepidiprofundi DSM 19306]